MMRRWREMQGLFLVLLSALAGLQVQGAYRVGHSKVDVTGPVSNVNMMGYADVMQRATGLLNRLYARAFVIEQDLENGETKRVALVHCDIHSIPLQLHETVIERLSSKTNGKFNKDNVMIHAQHTHAGPGGLHTFYLYYLSVLGFTPLHFEMVAEQLVQAVLQASDRVEARNLFMTQTEITECSANRSPEAYMQNPRKERDRYSFDKNTVMTIVKVTPVDDASKVLALWTFFAVHTTSLVGGNTLISSDNKGYAEWLLEMHYREKSDPDFVAAFFQTEAGDISPNVVDNKDGTFTGKHKEDFIRNAEHIGHCQAQAARVKVDSSETNWVPIQGDIFAHKRYFDFSRHDLGQGRTTCPAVSGVNMIAGTEDGRGLPFIYEGNLRTRSNWLVEFIGKWILLPTSVPEEVEKCQYPKVAVFATGVTDPPATPQVLPMQLIGLGNFVFAALPFEVTTMAGRRIAESVMNAIDDRQGCDHVVVAAVSNAYAGYLTTREEYQVQHYEGACTHFGQYQLEAVQDMLTKLYKERDGSGAPNVEPLLSDPLHVFTPVGTTLFDKNPSGPPLHPIGSIYQDVDNAAALRRRQVASAQFWCAPPRNSQLLVKSFCDVEQEQGKGEWVTVLNDHDWNVRFRYNSKFFFYGICTCQWVIPEESDFISLPTGSHRFRLRFRGIRDVNEDSRVEFYGGVSSPFSVSDEVAPVKINLSSQILYGIPEELLAGAGALAFLFLFTKAILYAAPLNSTPLTKAKMKAV